MSITYVNIAFCVSSLSVYLYERKYVIYKGNNINNIYGWQPLMFLDNLEVETSYLGISFIKSKTDHIFMF